MAPTSPFPSTCWSVILTQPLGSDDSKRRAWDFLAAGYEEPIRAWLQSVLGKRPDEAMEVSQGFWHWMLETGFPQKADPARGSFRAFLKTALRNYVRDGERHRRSERRGGHGLPRSLDAPLGADGGPRDVPDPRHLEPDRLLDAVWKRQTVERALANLQRRFEGMGKHIAADVFKDYYMDRAPELDYGTLAARYGITRVDVSNILSRTKTAYREELRAVVRETVRGPLDLEDELRWLLETP